MANVSTTLNGNFLASLVNDTALVTGLGITPAEIITSNVALIANRAASSNPNKIAPLAGTRGVNLINQSSNLNYPSLNMDFNSWFFLTKHYLDDIQNNVANSYNVGMVANLFGSNVWYLNATKRAFIVGLLKK